MYQVASTCVVKSSPNAHYFTVSCLEFLQDSVSSLVSNLKNLSRSTSITQFFTHQAFY